MGSCPRKAVRSKPRRPRRWRETHAPAERMSVNPLVGNRMPRVARRFAESCGDAHDHRCGERVHRAPAHRAAIVDLFGGGIGVFTELNFRNGHQPRKRHSHGAPDDAVFVERRVKPRSCPNFNCKSTVAPCTPPFSPTSSPKIRTRGFARNSVSNVWRIASIIFTRGFAEIAFESPLEEMKLVTGGQPPNFCNSLFS